jgi:hypothetical protein
MIYQEIFDNLDKVIDYLNGQGWSLSRTYVRNSPYEVMDYGNGNIVYYPSPFATPLFRGQSKFFEPCVSSLYRSENDSITHFIDKLKVEEFRLVTSTHPVIREESLNGFYFNHIALAQHYGFRTEMLDLTNSLPVAAFFAVTQFVAGKYIPMDNSDHPGVFYFVSPMKQFDFLSFDDSPEVFPVGWQVFKRPGEQRAFGINLCNHLDLNFIPGVFAFRFWHDLTLSNRIFSIFNGGADLFPDDVFAAKAARINELNVFSRLAFDSTFDHFNPGLTKELLLEELEKRNLSIQDKPVFEYSPEDIVSITELLRSGKLTENLTAFSRLTYAPDNEKENLF